jgi:hypothetical protein
LRFVVLAVLALSSLTFISAIPTKFDIVPTGEGSPSEAHQAVSSTVEEDYGWLSYTEKMAIGVFGRIAGLDGE